MDNREPLISIIVPVYNQEKNLDRCLTSIQNQSYHNLEIILIDDGSTDNSGIICEKWSKEDNRFKVIHQENTGVCRARNTAMDQVKGDYLTFIDSDDFVVSTYVEYLYRALIEDDCKMSFCRCKEISEDRANALTERGIDTIKASFNHLRLDLIKEVDYRKSDYLRQNCGCLYQREILAGQYFTPGIFNGEDALFNAEVLSKVKVFSLVDEDLYYYVCYDHSASHGYFDKKKATFIPAWEKIIDIYKPFGFDFCQGCYVCLANGCKDGLLMLYCNQGDKELYEPLMSEIHKIKKYINESDESFVSKLGFEMICVCPNLFFMAKNIKQKLKRNTE